MKTVKRAQLSKLLMVAGGEKRYKRVICGKNVLRWVGIGWVAEGEPTAKQRAELPHVVD